MRSLSGKEWLLVATGLSSERAAPNELDRVRLMKTLFVFSKNMAGAVQQPYQFEPYNYGPFDAAVYRDAEQLADEGFIEIRQGRYPSYVATPKGVARVNELVAETMPQAVEYMRRVRDWALSVDFSTLVKAIYQQWPDMRAKSVFQDS